MGSPLRLTPAIKIEGVKRIWMSSDKMKPSYTTVMVTPRGLPQDIKPYGADVDIFKHEYGGVTYRK